MDFWASMVLEPYFDNTQDYWINMPMVYNMADKMTDGKAYNCRICQKRCFSAEIIKCHQCRILLCNGCIIENKCIECYIKENAHTFIKEYYELKAKA